MRGAAYKLRWLRKLLTGHSLTVTMEGTGSATAKIFQDKIIVDASAAQSGKYINISTPLGFKVIPPGIYLQHDNATECTVQTLNTAGEIIPAITIAASDTDVDGPAVSIDNAYAEFSAGDDDLRFEIGTAAFTGRIVLFIELTP